MPKSVTSYSLLISCPSDVAQYLPQLQEAVSSFNRTFGKQNSITIETLHYSQNAYSNMSKDRSAQDEINKQLLSEADMLVGIFWTRFGQPTEKYESGTEEEIDKMIERGKPVILYFLDKPVSPSKVDIHQLEKIKYFKEKHKNDGLYKVLENEMELGLKLREELELRFTELLKRNSSSRDVEPSEEKIILWVDDRPGNNRYGIEHFQDTGIEVVPVLSTKRALEYLDTHSVSVIISDMGRNEGPNGQYVPKAGYKLLDELRERGNHTPFIIFAGSRSSEHIRETIRRGGQGTTNDFTELFNMVSAIILGTYKEQALYL